MRGACACISGNINIAMHIVMNYFASSDPHRVTIPFHNICNCTRRFPLSSWLRGPPDPPGYMFSMCIKMALRSPDPPGYTLDISMKVYVCMSKDNLNVSGPPWLHSYVCEYLYNYIS